MSIRKKNNNNFVTSVNNLSKLSLKNGKISFINSKLSRSGFEFLLKNHQLVSSQRVAPNKWLVTPSEIFGRYSNDSFQVDNSFTSNKKLNTLFSSSSLFTLAYAKKKVFKLSELKLNKLRGRIIYTQK